MSIVKILHPSIDEFEKTVVIRGVVDNASLKHLKTDYYQRELLPSVARKSIRKALEDGDNLPDIELGMRGCDFSGDDPSRFIELQDPVFIVDGQQRVKTVIEWLTSDHEKPARLGATIHLNTTPEWEKGRFQKLNQLQKKVSPNILLRNLKEEHPVVATMYGLTTADKQFVLYDRVSWSQFMKRSHLISAVTMVHVIMRLHSHLAAGLSSGVSYTVLGSDVLVQRIGLPVVRTNIKAFFNLIDEVWGIRRIHIKGGAAYMRRPFLEVLARLLSDHPEFWKDDKRLEVGHLWKRKLGVFEIGDPEIVRLAAATGAARNTLYFHILQHLNSGKRINRLVSRKPSITFASEEASEEEGEEGSAA